MKYFLFLLMLILSLIETRAQSAKFDIIEKSTIENDWGFGPFYSLCFKIKNVNNDTVVFQMNGHQFFKTKSSKIQGLIMVAPNDSFLFYPSYNSSPTNIYIKVDSFNTLFYFIKNRMDSIKIHFKYKCDNSKELLQFDSSKIGDCYIYRINYSADLSQNPCETNSLVRQLKFKNISPYNLTLYNKGGLFYNDSGNRNFYRTGQQPQIVKPNEEFYLECRFIMCSKAQWVRILDNFTVSAKDEKGNLFLKPYKVKFIGNVIEQNK